MLSHDQILDYLLMGQGGIGSVHLLCTFFVLHNRFAGFIGFFTSILYLAVTAFSYYGLKQALNRTIFGAILGAGTIMLFLSLESAIFWGQYSNCEGFGRRLYVLRGSSSEFDAALLEDASGKSEFATHLEPIQAEQRQLFTTPDCEHTSAMKAVCAFSVFMFLSYLLLLGVLMRFKNELLNAVTSEDGSGHQPQQGYTKVPGSSGSTASGAGLGPAPIPPSADF